MPYKVLFLDDESYILRAIEEMLADQPFDTISCETVEDAFKVLDSEPIQIVVSDLRMPGMDGITFLNEVKKRYPDALRILLTGIVEVDDILKSINTGQVFRYITKPIQFQQSLIPAILQAIQTFDLQDQIRHLNQELVQKNDELESKVKERTKELEESKTLAERHLKIRANFLGNVSHEVKTPIMVLNGAVDELMTYDRYSTKEKEMLKLVKESSTRIFNFWTNVSELTILRTDGIHIHKEAFLLDKFVTQLVKAVKPTMAKKKIGFEYKVPAEIKIIADKNQLLHILSNLIENAIKFTKEGNIGFWTTISRNNDGMGILEAFVTNTGDSIPKEMETLVFEEFVQSQIGLTKNQNGIGVSLTVAKYLTELLGGQISFSREASLGNIFRIELPVLIVS